MKKRLDDETKPEPAAPKRRRSRPATALRRPELIQFAAAAFSKSGYAAASLRDIGEMAGIKAPSFYHHFSSKEELLSVIVSETLDRIFEMLLSEISGIEDPEQKLRRVIGVHIQFIIDNRLQTKVVFEESAFLNEADRAALKTKQRAILDIYRMLLRTACGSRALSHRQPHDQRAQHPGDRPRRLPLVRAGRASVGRRSHRRDRPHALRRPARQAARRSERVNRSRMRKNTR
jgi:AcrR family transcriptional regulator